MAAAPLTSNHVNYLIWRYLQESGHDKSAARLQRDWKIGDPETLPFARHIKTHALVSLVQKGLQYHELETSLQQSGDRATQTPTALFFGTEFADALPSSRDPNDAHLPVRGVSPRKHPRESIAGAGGIDSSAQAPAAKRQRRTRDGPANANVAKSGDEMDVDQQNETRSDRERSNESNVDPDDVLPNGKIEQQDLAAGVLPSEALAATAPAAPTPSPPPVPTLENGQSVPTQTDSVVEVGKEHTQLLETEPSREALLMAWHPHQANLLISGGDGLCRLFRWPVHFGDAPATNGAALGGPAPHTHDLFESMAEAKITALAWDPEGQHFVVARHLVDADTASMISLFEQNGTLVSDLSQSQQFIFGLTYSPSGRYLLGHGGLNEHHPDGSRDFCLCIWDMTSLGSAPRTMLTAERQEISGATWINDDSIIACGPAYIAQTRLVDGALQDWQPVSPSLARGSDEDPYDWSTVVSDKYSGTCVLSASRQGLLAILSQDRQSLITQKAHGKPITELQYQPLPQHGSTGQGPRLVASASEDGTVKIWNAAKGLSLLKCLHCDTLQPSLHPVLAMQFSPDGATLAAATYNRVVFWRPDREGAWLSAQWALDNDLGWKTSGSLANGAVANGEEVKVNGVVNGVNGHSKSNGSNGTNINEAVQTDGMSIDGEESRAVDWLDDGDEASATTLLWSAMGKKIAFGSRNQLAIADFTKAHS